MAGVYTPFRLETNNWFKKIGYCATGVDVYAGPKLSASFVLDPVALAESKDPYSMFSNTQIQFTPKCFVAEGKAIFSAGGQNEKEYKLFNAEAGFGQMTLNLFPKFEEKVKFGELYNVPSTADFSGNFLSPINVHATVYPVGNSLPFDVGIAVYNSDQELCNANGWNNYSVWNTWTEYIVSASLFDGTYTIYPALNVMGVIVPVFSAGSTITVDCPLQFEHNTTPNLAYHYLPSEGFFYVGHVLNKDDAIYIEYEDVGGKLHSLGCELVDRSGVEGIEESGAPEFFQRATFKYKLDDAFYKDVATDLATFHVTVYRGGKSRTITKYWRVKWGVY
jgi:hypothetical protein